MDLLRDIRASAWVLIQKPGFTIVVVLTLAVGIAANTAIFSVVNGVLLAPLPYRQEDRIVTLWQREPARGVEREETSPASYFDWLEQSRSFEALGMAEPWGHLMIGEGEPEAIRSWIVSPGFFEALGAAALHGRTFLPEEYEAGSPVVIVGYRWWQRHFGGDASLIGKKLTFNNVPTTVVGIMPPDFEYPPGRELWGPRARRPNDPQSRGRTFCWVVGRLRPERTVEQAQQEMNAVAMQLAEQYPQTDAGIGIALVPLRRFLFGDVRPALLVLFGAVGLIVLLACANVASLLLVRGLERQGEFAIRIALGARRSRILRQLMTESLAFAALGGASGILLARWLIHVIVGLSADSLPRLDRVEINPAVLLFAVSLSVLTALLFGLAPAFHTTRLNLHDVLKEATRAATAGNARQRFRSALVIAQIAIAFVLLVGAGLLARSFAALVETDPGFPANKALTLEVSLARRTQGQRVTFLDQTMEKLAALPGIVGAGAASALPFSANQVTQPTTIKIEDRPSVAAEGDVTADLISVTPDYFQALGVPLIRGRVLTRFDRKEEPFAVINQTMALRYWPAEDPVGKRISFRSYGGNFTTEIVGVVGDMRTAGLEQNPKPEIFVSYASAIGYPNAMTYFVRTANDPLPLLTVVKETIHEVDKNQALSGVATIDELVERSLRRRRFTLVLFASFAVLALTLASVGLYGLVSFMTVRRTREIGIRMAFGAGRRDLLKMMIGGSMALTLAGVGIGLLASLALTRLIESLLIRINKTDPVTFVVIVVVLGIVQLIACSIPASRATKVDPILALRHE